METVILSRATIKTDIYKITVSNHFKEHRDVSIMEISIPVTLDTIVIFQHGLQLKLLLRTLLQAREKNMHLFHILVFKKCFQVAHKFLFRGNVFAHAY